MKVTGTEHSQPFRANVTLLLSTIQVLAPTGTWAAGFLSVLHLPLGHHLGGSTVTWQRCLPFTFLPTTQITGLQPRTKSIQWPHHTRSGLTPLTKVNVGERETVWKPGPITSPSSGAFSGSHFPLGTSVNSPGNKAGLLAVLGSGLSYNSVMVYFTALFKVYVILSDVILHSLIWSIRNNLQLQGRGRKYAETNLAATVRIR